MVDVRIDLVRKQGFHAVFGDHAPTNALPLAAAVEPLRQFGLARDHDLQQPALVAGQSRQHGEIARIVQAQMLGRVDHQKGGSAIGAFGRQKLFHGRATGFGLPGIGQAKGDGDLLDQRDILGPRQRQHRHDRIIPIDLPQDVRNQLCLAHTRPAGDRDDARAAIEPEADRAHRTPVRQRRKMEAGIWIGLERPFLQSENAFVHAPTDPIDQFSPHLNIASARYTSLSAAGPCPRKALGLALAP